MLEKKQDENIGEWRTKKEGVWFYKKSDVDGVSLVWMKRIYNLEVILDFGRNQRPTNQLCPSSLRIKFQVQHNNKVSSICSPQPAYIIILSHTNNVKYLIGTKYPLLSYK
jgi:plasmid rolling circle replication initiator protein Rep